MKYFVVEPGAAGERLDKFLARKTDQTRNQLQKAIKNGLVLVNDAPATPHCFLNAKDKISLRDAQTVPPPTGNKQEKEKTDQPEILSATRDFLIVCKPAGWLVHPTAKNESDTLIHWLIKKYPTLKKISDAEDLQRRSPFYRPAIIHRLDRDVSGIMLVPRTQTAFDYYKKLFQTRAIRKTYVALVHGKPPRENGVIDFEISRSAGGKRMAAHPAGSGKGRPALTEYLVLKHFRTYSLLELRPRTGRTNQLRAHLQALGCPMVGDSVYARKKFTDKLPLRRVFLHAQTIAFTDMQGTEQQFSCPLPLELQTILDCLR